MIDFGTKNRRLNKKTVGGTLTEFAYDRANQLVQSKVTNPGNPEILPKTTDFAYDAAGRLIKEGDKSYTYGYLDKVLAVHENPANPLNPVKKSPVATFDYDITGQIASAHRGASTENFLWDGLALIHRDGVNYLNEPHAGGGAPVLAGSDKVLFNDLLGSTVGTLDGNGAFASANLTTYGEGGLETGNSQLETGADAPFFTGKPHVAGLGHAFLLRNYRADLGKWQTADPFGSPDGLNNFAYCNGWVTSAVDWLGAEAWYLQYVDGEVSNLSSVADIVKAGEDYQLALKFSSSVDTYEQTQSITVTTSIYYSFETLVHIGSFTTWSIISWGEIMAQTTYTIDNSGMVTATPVRLFPIEVFVSSPIWMWPSEGYIATAVETQVPNNFQGTSFTHKTFGIGAYSDSRPAPITGRGNSLSFGKDAVQTEVLSSAITIKKIKQE